ncbi:ABC transporter ATP-binding protein [Paenibacillus senegalensis]|uniref:ABC transporter ATP-binding protein n=1 Tax=Paenibacillus senegalensis TaxID=1465766 RepID=UPI00028A22E2|nr:ABC transporter ATP-binding protein [Paenibacillus senegalensis]
MHQLNVNHIGVSLAGHPILQSISFAARSGELIGLIGPNGSGKSTLLRTLAGLQPYQQGEIKLNQSKLPAFRPRELARIIGYVPQDTSLGFDFSVRDIVLMGRHAHIPRFGLESPRDLEIVQEALERTAIADLADRLVTSLSGGQRQMAFIAKALAQEPGILLFDEPVSALDINRQLQVLELIRELANEGILAIAALHDLNLAARFCDRLILIQDGQLQSNGAPDEVLNPHTLLSSYQVLSAVRHDEMVDAAAVTALGYKEAGQSYETDAEPRPSVYVVGGAGSASGLLALLHRLNCKVTAGPMEAHDPDARLARDLGMKVIISPSFCKISPGLLHQCQKEQLAADLVIAAPVPMGDNNQELRSVLSTTNVLTWLPDREPGTAGTPLLTDYLNSSSIVNKENLTTIIQQKKEEIARETVHS